MSIQDALMITPSLALSLTIWLIVLICVLYFARTPAHLAIRSLCGAINSGLRLGSRSIANSAHRLAGRNREVLLAAGREAQERIIEREFDRVDNMLRKDMANYPAIHRQLNESIERIEQDHQESIEVPPSPPAWVNAIEAVAGIPSKSEYMVGNILADIHKSLIKAHKQAMAEYHDANRERHRLLRNMMPSWRRVKQSLDGLDANVTRLLERSKTIDRRMTEYEEMVRGTDRAAQTLASSSLIHFFISAIVLAVAVGGAAINFSLIARPMAEMVGGTSFVGEFRTADIAALVIILVEISMGLFLMESLRITRLFPVIGALPDKIRMRMVWVTFVILLLLASVEAGLAYMREILLQDELATSALLRGDDVTGITNDFMWITTAAQMGMGFVLPFALVFVAIPLETFIHSLRNVAGIGAVMLLRGAAAALRFTGTAFKQLGVVMVHVYDVVVFAPLWIEHRLKGRSSIKDDELQDIQPAGGTS